MWPSQKGHRQELLFHMFICVKTVLLGLRCNLKSDNYSDVFLCLFILIALLLSIYLLISYVGSSIYDKPSSYLF